MKKIFILSLVLLQQFLFAQTDTAGSSADPYFFTREGNSSYVKKDYKSAIDKYSLAASKDSLKNAANYNLGNAYYKNGDYDKAAAAYANAISGSDADSLSKAWHNLGNAMLKQKQYGESINAYKQSLKLNPKDDDTRYNLAYAQKMLQAQQQQQQQQNNQDSSGGSGDKQKQQQQQNSDQQKQSSDQQQNSDQQNSDQQKQNSGQQQQQQQQDPNSMSQTDAQRMLDAMKDEERNTRNNMNKNNKAKNSGYRSLSKDW